MAKKLQEVHSEQFEAKLSTNWDLARFDDISDVTDYVANGSFASLKANVKYLDEPAYAILVRFTDHVKGWNGNYKYVDEHAYNFLSKSSVKPGDLVVANVGAPGKVFVVPNLDMPMTLGPNSVLIKPREGIDNRYLAYFFESGWAKDLIAQITTGTAQKKFNKTGLRSTYIPVAPPEQQKRIVAKIEELFSHIDAGIEGLKKTKQLLKQYRQSVLKAAVTGELTKEWREKNKDKLKPASKLLERILAERRKKWEEQQLEQFKAKGKMPKDDKWKGKFSVSKFEMTDLLPELPTEWCWTSLDCITSPSRSLTYGVIKLGNHKEDGVPTLRSSNVRHLGIELKGLKKIESSLSKQYSRTILEGTEVLITVRGTLGGVSAVSEEHKGWNISREVAMIHPMTFYDKKCLAIFIGSMPIQNWFSRNTKGIAYTGINIETLKKTPIPILSLDEQRTIVTIVNEKLEAISRLESEIGAHLIKSEKNKQSILSSAFSGRLVEGLNSDGDVETLLLDIKKQRAIDEAKQIGVKRKKSKKIRGKIMSIRKVIDVLQEASGEISTDELFEAAGYSSDASPDKVEEFYLDLKSAVEFKNVEVLEIAVDGIKQGNKFKYKV